MSDAFLKNFNEQNYKKRISEMSVEEMMTYLKELGCTYSYEELVDKLSHTYNELAVSDMIFETCTIDDSNSTFPKGFIDDAIYEIVLRLHKFPYQHYGVIISRFVELAEKRMGREEKLKAFEETFQAFFKMAKQCSLDNFDAMVYQVNDGVDLMSLIIDYLDECMEYARMEDKQYFKKIIQFIEKMNRQFPYKNPYFEVSLRYEMAKAYVAMKSTKGEQMFLQLLKEDLDKTDVVLHYGLAYLDDQPKKTMRIFEKYRNLLDKESDSYEIIQEIIQEEKTSMN